MPSAGRPPHHDKTTTITAALRATGLIAEVTFEGAANGMRFRADNLNAHKVTGVREAIEAVGARVLCLPPYSPDLNPIEQSPPRRRLSSGRLQREPPTT